MLALCVWNGGFDFLCCINDILMHTYNLSLKIRSFKVIFCYIASLKLALDAWELFFKKLLFGGRMEDRKPKPWNDRNTVWKDELSGFQLEITGILIVLKWMVGSFHVKDGCGRVVYSPEIKLMSFRLARAM